MVERSNGDRVTYLAYRSGAGLAQAVPPSLGEPAARMLGRMVSLAAPERRRLVRRNLERVYGGSRTGLALERSVTETFESYGRYWLELFRLPHDPERFVDSMTHDGFEHVEAAAAAGRGVIAALPHLGGWETGGLWMTTHGHRLTVVVEPVEPPELFEWFVEVRQALGFEVVALGPDAGPATLRALRAGEMVCLVCDRDLTGEGVSVEFFGERTTLPAGPAALALRTGAALLPAAVYFTPRGGHHAVVRPPLDTTRAGRLRDNVAEVTQRLAFELERLVRAAPEQWHLMQPNWPSDRDGAPDVAGEVPAS